jgi:hypothetical protein
MAGGHGLQAAPFADPSKFMANQDLARLLLENRSLKVATMLAYRA